MNARIFAASAIITALSVATAWADPISERQELMKANGRAAGTIAPMIRGQQPFDAAAAQAALKTLADDATAMDVEKLFPQGSEGGKAGPAIWSDRAGFVAAVEKFRTDTAAAVAANVQDLDGLRQQFGAVQQNCSGCHQAFRTQ